MTAGIYYRSAGGHCGVKRSQDMGLSKVLIQLGVQLGMQRCLALPSVVHELVTTYSRMQ